MTITHLQDQSHRCTCVRAHNPDPLQLNRHHIVPKELGGASVDDNLVWVCPTTHASVHTILQAFLTAGKQLTQAQYKAQNQTTRAIPRQAWSLAVMGYMAHVAGRDRPL